MASCGTALRVAISTFQLIELAYPGRIQECGIPHACVDEREDERPSGATIRNTVFSALRWPVVVPDNGSRISGHQQHCQCLDGQRGVEILEDGGTQGKC